jgi:hypothetical protein
MLKIIDTQTRVNAKTKEEYQVVVLLGNVEVLRSKSNSKPYLSAKKVTLPTTLNQQQAQELIGTSLPGEIEKVDCPEYEIKMPGTNKKVKINHTFQYAPASVEKG